MQEYGKTEYKISPEHLDKELRHHVNRLLLVRPFRIGYGLWIPIGAGAIAWGGFKRDPGVTIAGSTILITGLATSAIAEKGIKEIGKEIQKILLVRNPIAKEHRQRYEDWENLRQGYENWKVLLNGKLVLTNKKFSLLMKGKTKP